jgi:hypothetical protein
MFDDIFVEDMKEVSILKCEEEQNSFVENYKKFQETYTFLTDLKLETIISVFKELISYIAFLADAPKSFLASFIKLARNINTFSNDYGIIIDLEDLAYNATGKSIQEILNNIIDNFSIDLLGISLLTKNRAKFSAVINKAPVFTLATELHEQTNDFNDDTGLHFDINNNFETPADKYLKLINGKSNNKTDMLTSFGAYHQDKAIMFYNDRKHEKLAAKNNICNKFLNKINYIIKEIKHQKDKILDIIIILKYNSPDNYINFNEEQQRKMLNLTDSINSFANLLNDTI